MKKYTILIIGLLLMIGLIGIYSNHFNNSFHFDDAHTIVTNPHIRDLSNIPEFFVNPEMFSSKSDHQGLRPIVTTTLAIDYWLADGYENTFFFHLSTFLFFLFTGVLIYLLYQKITQKAVSKNQSRYLALFITAIYCFHTANAETINYIISRSDVISTFFAVLTLVCYISLDKSWYKYLILIITSSLGILTKEAIALFPIVVFFYAWFFEEDKSVLDLFKIHNWSILFETTKKVLPILIPIVILQIYTMLNNEMGPTFSNPLSNYLITQPYIWLHYFITFFFPFNLSADTDMTVFANFLDERAILGLFFIITLFYLIIKFSKDNKTKPISFGLIWFTMALIPTSVVPLAEVTNDHRMFFPFIGLALAIIYFFANRYLINRDWAFKSKLGLLLCCVFILVGFGYGTYQRNKVWKNGETLWHDVTIKSPNNGRGLMNYGLTFMRKGEYVKALDLFKKAKLKTPYYPTLYINLGIVYNALGEFTEAENNFKKSIQYGLKNSNTYFYYARFLFAQNRFLEAKEMAEKSSDLNKYYLDNEHLLLQIYAELKLEEQLRSKAKHILSFSKDDILANNVLANKEMISINTEKPSSVNELINLSLYYYNKGLYSECIKICEKVLQKDSMSHIAWNNICSSYNQIGEYKKAYSACEKALEINSDFPLARNNLRMAKENLDPN